jgi:hypothetical protein
MGRGASATTTGASTPSAGPRLSRYRTSTLSSTVRGGSCFFTKLDLASSYHQLRVWTSDRRKTRKTSFRSQMGQFEWNVVPFGLQGSSSLLIRVMNEALTVGLGPSPAVSGGMPGASAPLGRCALVYMDDCLVHSQTLEQHLLDVAEVLEIFRRRKLFAKSSKRESRRQELPVC